MIASSTAAAGGLSAGLGIVWIVVLFGIMYFMMIRPQKKEQKRTQTMLNSMEVGDSVVTTSGFYGVVIDMTEEDVIVEFGNNKNSLNVLDTSFSTFAILKFLLLLN